MKIVPPALCPACGCKTSFVNDQLFCTNNDCEARVNKKVIKFCKVFGIKGLGERQIEKFAFDSLFDAINTLLSASTDTLALSLGSVVLAEKLHPQLDVIKHSLACPETFASIAVYLVEGFPDAYTSAFQLNMNQW